MYLKKKSSQNNLEKSMYEQKVLAISEPNIIEIKIRIISVQDPNIFKQHIM